MARSRSRRSRRRSSSKGDQAVQEVTDFIEDNPVTSAVVAMAAGAVATSVFKMFMASQDDAEDEGQEAD